MNTFTRILPVFLLAAGFVVWNGCSKNNSTEPITTDEELFNTVISGNDATNADLFLTDENALDESSQLKSLAKTIARELTLASITPLRWGRVIDSRSRSITRPITRLGDSIAIAETQVTFTGKFVIQALSGQDTVVIRKPFTETIRRNVKFERIANTRYPRLNWRLDAVSVATGGTENPGISIPQVEVITPNQTLTVTDPLNYYMEIDHRWMRRLPVIHDVPVTVRVTVVSASPDSDIVTLHFVSSAFGLHHSPFTLVSSNGSGGTFTRVYEKTGTISGSVRKFAHLMVSATTPESLYSDATDNFSSTVIGIPYKVSE